LKNTFDKTHSKSASREFLAMLTTHPETLARYQQPERGRAGWAAGLLRPETPDEVQTLLRQAPGEGWRYVISAGRTGLVEAQRPEGEVVLSLERLTRILAEDEHSITVEAGLSVDVLNAHLVTRGKVWPMEMGSTSSASVGACIANASAGANAVCYGTGAHLCLSAQGFWGNGEPAHSLGWDWNGVNPQALAVDSSRLQPSLIGSQGIFGVMTQATLRLYDLPQQREGVLLPLNTLDDGLRLLALAQSQFCVEEAEFWSDLGMDWLQHLQGAAFRNPLSQRAPFYLLLQVSSPDPSGLDEALYAFLEENGLSSEGYAPIKALKTLRHSLTEASNLQMRKRGLPRYSFDTAVPRARFAAYLAALHSGLPAQDSLFFGHIGVGGLHLHVLGEDPTAFVIACTLAHGGTFSAEHGIGQKWAQHWQQHSPQVAAVRAWKQQFDPHFVLNGRSFGLSR
jgi:FAD/FMN-containing dehydrogenase